ncbi:DUF4336 domain-containing protein [bacterium]|nr:DUF4336 domain-containing protein [bacterium]
MEDSLVSSESIKFPHAPPREIAPALWVVDGTWSNALARRMTVVRLRNNEVWIHNPMQLAAPELAWLASLGFVRGIVAPNKWHVSDLRWMAEKFPQAQLMCPLSFLEKNVQLKDRILCTTDVPYVTNDHELEFFPVTGVRFEETVLFHPLTRTLIVCDLMMNMRLEGSWLQRTFFKCNNMGECCAPTRVLKWVMTSNRDELLAFVEQMAELNPRRIVVNHGEIFEGEGGNQIRTSFSSLFW